MFGNFVVRAAHVPMAIKTNCASDALSRKQIAKFFNLVPGACHQPTEISKEVLDALVNSYQLLALTDNTVKSV